jgi:hypothetical protein
MEDMFYWINKVQAEVSDLRPLHLGVNMKYRQKPSQMDFFRAPNIFSACPAGF